MYLKNLSTIILLSTMITIIAGCNKIITDNITTDNGNDISFTEYSLNSAEFQDEFYVEFVNSMFKDCAFIINSKKELEKYIYFPDDSYNEIDFSKHSLILVMGFSFNIISDISKNLQQSSTKYLLNLEITTLKNAQYRQLWKIALITNKMSEKCNIELNIKTSFDEHTEPLLDMDMGTYTETYPSKGRTKFNFIDKEKCVLMKYCDSENEDSRVTYEYQYEIRDYSIRFISEGAYPYYFHIINNRKFEIGYLYITNAWGGTIPPIMVFEKK